VFLDEDNIVVILSVYQTWALNRQVSSELILDRR
jgi:hypothetical protein